MSYPHWHFRILYPGDSGSDVGVVQVKVGAYPTRVMDETTVALVRGFQRVHNLPITGTVDHTTAQALGENTEYGLVPKWWQPPLIDEVGLRDALHIRAGVGLDDAVRRFQSSHGMYPDGEMTERLAIIIGD